MSKEQRRKDRRVVDYRWDTIIGSKKGLIAWILIYWWLSVWQWWHWGIWVIFTIVIGIIFLWKDYLYLPKNKKDKSWNLSKFWIVISIDDKWILEWYTLKQDFIWELNQSLSNSYNLIILPSKYAEKVKKMSKEEQIKLNNKIGGHYWIYWKVEKAKDGVYKCCIDVKSFVFHQEIPKDIQREFQKEFQDVSIPNLEFEDDYYRSWLLFSSSYTTWVAKYILGIAFLIWKDIVNAWIVHKDLHKDLENIKQNEEKLNQQNKQKNIKDLESKSRAVQYLETRVFTNIAYRTDNIELWKEFLAIWYDLVEFYKVPDCSLLNSQAIYEFLHNNDAKKARELIKKSFKLGNKWARYSLVFLDIWNRDYWLAKNNIEQILKTFKKGKNKEIVTVVDVISFIDKVLEKKERNEFLYWQAILYHYKLNNFDMALEKINLFLEKENNNSFWFEIMPATKLKREIIRWSKTTNDQ